MSKVLVVGATGLLGRSVFREIERRGHEAHGAARRVDQDPIFHELDLRDLDESTAYLRKLEPDVVIQMTGGAQSGDATELVATHILPTINLVAASSQVDRPPALIITGSAAEYGATPPGERASEDSGAKPVSGYGWIKAAETSLARSLAAVRGLALTAIRPFNIVSRDLPEITALGNFRRQILEGRGSLRTVRCGRIDIVRDYVTAPFVGSAVAELVESRYEGVVNICSGQGIELEQLLLAAGSLLEVGLRFEIDPALAAIPAVPHVVGDPTLLYSLVEARAITDVDELARELLGSVA